MVGAWRSSARPWLHALVRHCPLKIIEVTPNTASFDFSLTRHGLRTSVERLCMNQLPRYTRSSRLRLPRIVFLQTFLNIFCGTNILTLQALTVENVNIVQDGMRGFDVDLGAKAPRASLKMFLQYRKDNA